jgi:putative PIN family toxin of toxin-antitoxin system
VKALRAVIDTNVLFSGLYSAEGASFRILRGVEEGRIIPLLSTPILFEYEEVLKRNSKVLQLSSADIDATLDAMCSRGEAQAIYFLWRPRLKDPKDDHVLELAVAGDAPIVTHNIGDFEPARAMGVRVYKPGEFLRRHL